MLYRTGLGHIHTTSNAKNPIRSLISFQNKPTKMERYPHRDRRLKDFASQIQEGNELPDLNLQTDFLSFARQIARSKACRMNLVGERLEEAVGTAVFNVTCAFLNGRYKPGRAPAASFISTVTRNAVYGLSGKERARQNWKENQALIPQDASLRPTEDAVLYNETLNHALELIEELPPRQQDVVNMTLSGFNQAEISEHLNIECSALRNVLYRARRTLRGRFKLAFSQ